MYSDNPNTSISEPSITQEHKPPKRNLLMILHNMIRVIPDKGEENLKSDLEYELNRASFTPPENMYSIWLNVQNIITERFKTHHDTTNLPEWCSLLVDIWTDRKKD